MEVKRRVGMGMACARDRERGNRNTPANCPDMLGWLVQVFAGRVD